VLMGNKLLYQVDHGICVLLLLSETALSYLASSMFLAGLTDDGLYDASKGLHRLQDYCVPTHEPRPFS
jgi:hypothetical protein